VSTHPQDEIFALALAAAKAAGDFLNKRPEVFDVTLKSSRVDFATHMDKNSEKLIVDLILSHRPDDGIIGEEGSSRPSKSGITWVIDPLDGTVNYFYGLPGWNVSIAACDEQGELVGVVNAPSINKLWSASRGKGATCNDQPITCNDPVDLSLALLATGFAYDLEMRHKQGALVAHLVPQLRDIRRMGAAAVDMCFVAMGALDGYFEYGLSPWDRAAGTVIAREAGVVVTNLSGGEPDGQMVIAAGPTLHPQLAEQVRAVWG
jgi:myo-inositol-1(or 4)-monophosphatase